MNPYLAFRDPEWLGLLLLLPVAWWWRSRRGTIVLLVPFAALWHRPTVLRRSWWTPAAVVSGLILLTLAMARPQRVQERWESKTRGYDIMLAIGLSSSMLAEDYKRDVVRMNRFEAIEPIVQAFIEHRPKDRIGIVLFSGRAYTLSPLTFDHTWLLRSNRSGAYRPDRRRYGNWRRGRGGFATTGSDGTAGRGKAPGRVCGRAHRRSE